MIETRKLTKKFGKNIALYNLDFNVEKGEIFCFLGIALISLARRN